MVSLNTSCLKKYVSALLTLVVVFGLFLPSYGSNVALATNDDDVIVLEEKTVTLTNSVESGIQSEESVLNAAQKEAIDNVRAKELEKVGIPKTTNTQLSRGEIPIGSVTLGFDLLANTSTGRITSRVTIVDIIGIKPSILSGSQYPQHSTYKNPSMGQWYWDDIFDNLVFTWSGSEIYEGQSASQSFPAETKWWSVFGGITANYPTGSTDYSDWETDYSLINKKAVIFPDYYDFPSGKWASDGVQTDWSVFPVGDRTTWNGTTDRALAIKQYIDTYGNPLGYNWGMGEPDYKQMHHMRPLLYGGTNSLDNLIPIGVSPHASITSWFYQY